MCSSATRAVRLRKGSTTTMRAPAARASSSLRHRCGAVDSGFQPHTRTWRAFGHSSGSTSGETPCVIAVPVYPAVAQIVRSSAVAPSVFSTRALMMSPWISPWVPMYE